MGIDRDLVKEEELSVLSKKVLQPNVLEYQLRSLFVRPGYRPRDIRVEFSYPQKSEEGEEDDQGRGFQLLISGPSYSEMETEEEYSPFIRQWREFFRNYLYTSPFRKKFINGMVQLRFVSFNPLTIYYQILSEEQKRISGILLREKSEIKMKRMVVKREKLDLKPAFRDKGGKAEIETHPAKLGYDGHLAVERSEEEAQRPGISSWAEGYVQDEIPADIRQVDPSLDFPQGAIMNMFPDYPFYAFGYWNVFRKIEEINRMIEAGLEVVFLEEVPGMNIGRVKTLYREFFTNWGIPIIDYVSSERIRESGLPYFIPSDNLLPGFFVIRRPIEKLHSSAWTGMNGGRRRGLPGIPWARDELSGGILIDPQPDDGFLGKFVKGGLKRILDGGEEETEIDFPLCTLHTPSEIQTRVIDPLEKFLRREVGFRTREDITASVRLRNIGEWMLLRGLMRKNL